MGAACSPELPPPAAQGLSFVEAAKPHTVFTEGLVPNEQNVLVAGPVVGKVREQLPRARVRAQAELWGQTKMKRRSV